MSNLLLKNYKGTGTFSIGKKAFSSSDFVLRMYNCKLIVNVKISLFDGLQLMAENMKDKMKICSFQGTTDDNGTLTAKKLYIDKIDKNISTNDSMLLELSPAGEINISYAISEGSKNNYNVYLLTNLLFGGDEFVQREGMKAKSIIEIENVKFNFIRLLGFDETKEKLKNSADALVTTEVTSLGNMPLEEELKQVIWPLCWLCTLGQHCFVSPLYYGIKSGNSWKRISYKPIKTYPFHNSSPGIDFSYQGHKDFQYFLEQCYNGYKKWNDILKLNVLIEYTAQADSFKVMDVSYLLLCIAFECLAENGKNFLETQEIRFSLSACDRNLQILSNFIKKHDFKVSDQELIKLSNSVSYNQPSFKEKLEKIFEYFDIKFTNDDLKFIDIRNVLIHSGVLPKDRDSHRASIELKDFYDKVIFSILGYKGGRHIVRTKKSAREILD